MAGAVTSVIRLVTAVALPAAHDPIALAKTIASLDHLSGGRVTLGVGFGWNTDELADHGVPAERRRTVLREYLEAMQALWSQDEASYRGSFISFEPAWAWPKPVQRPRVPIVVGAGGTQRTFAWIARSGDGWLTTPGESDLAAKLELLHAAWCDAARNGQPQVHVLAARPDLSMLEQWRAIGVTDVVYGLPDRSADEVVSYLSGLAARLGLAARAG